MKWLKRLRSSRLFKSRKPDRFKTVEHLIEEAFTVGGRTYYQFKDAFNMPYKRALISINYFEETRQKCTREYLVEFNEKIDKILTSNPVDIYKIKELNGHLRERLGFVMDESIIWKFASVVYFDDSEDPVDYDFKYAQNKIEFWREHSDATKFFFQTAILRYCPYLKDLDDNFPAYSKAVEEMTKMHTAALRSV